jgi:predicted phosphodiesterase
MKLAVLADIHSNLAAFRRVIEDVAERRPDRVIVAGDIINRGPQPGPCLELALEYQARSGWQLMRGNHEDYVLDERAENGARPEWLSRLRQHSRWTLDRIRPLAPALEQLPHQLEWPGPDGRPVRVVHGSMHGNRVGIYPRMSEQEIVGMIAPPPALLCAGHIHIPFVRTVHRTLVVNAGAVGMPFDGDRRASYALMEWTGSGWRAEIIRLPYDLDATRRAYDESGYLAHGGPMVRLIREELEQARPYLGPWHRDYEARVAAGRMSLDESVDELLRSSRAAHGTVSAP